MKYAIGYLGSTGMCSDSAGYWGGGNTGSTIRWYLHKWDFASENQEAITDHILVAKQESTCIFATTKGWICGGYGSGSYQSWIDDFIFADEESERIVTTMDNTAGSRAGLSHTGAYALVCGGMSPGYSTNIEQFTYANETGVDHASTLAQTVGYTCGTFGPLAGYVMGDYPVNAFVQKVAFATVTVSDLGAIMNEAKHSPAGISSMVKGYAAGGQTGARTKKIEDIDFATDTSKQVNDELNLAVDYNTGSQY
jgi:hypothetical protein